MDPKTDEKLYRWRTRSEDQKFSNDFLTLTEYHREEETTGRTHDFVLVTMRDWVNIIAITEDDKVVLVEQFRQASEQFETELPAGIVDDGEDHRQAVERELKEETGYALTEKSSVVNLGTYHPNPALLRNKASSFLVTNVTCRQEQHLDESERIRVRLEPMEAIDGLIRSGEITNADVICAFHLLDIHNRGEKR